MNRRDFITTTGLLTASVTMSACGTSDSSVEEQKEPEGAVSLYFEFRIAGPEVQKMVQNVTTQMNTLESQNGFLSLSLKQMVGESTMAKNLPTDLKGVMKSAFFDGASQGKRPFVYALMVRFDNYTNLKSSGAKAWFTSIIEPQLFAYKLVDGKPKKTPIVLDYHDGVYKTISAGDATGIYKTQKEIVSFLKNQKDVANPKYQTIPLDGSSNSTTMTVLNHVTIHDNDTKIMNEKTTALLTVAQQTYQPNSNAGNGTSGTLSDSNYKKAVTTEILQNAFSSGDTRNYLMHGVWESVADHENSHIDPRFMQAAGPVGAFVIDGPVEPFYQTSIVHNKA